MNLFEQQANEFAGRHIGPNEQETAQMLKTIGHVAVFSIIMKVRFDYAGRVNGTAKLVPCWPKPAVTEEQGRFTLGSVPKGEENYHHHVFFHVLGSDPAGQRSASTARTWGALPYRTQAWTTR